MKNIHPAVWFKDMAKLEPRIGKGLKNNIFIPVEYDFDVLFIDKLNGNKFHVLWRPQVGVTLKNEKQTNVGQIYRIKQNIDEVLSLFWIHSHWKPINC